MNSILDALQLLQFGWRDAVDILLVAIILYSIISLIRGTRAMQMSIGLLLLGGALVLARALDLIALESLSREIFFYLPFVGVVLFQTEIRRALANFGRNPLIAFFTPQASLRELEPLVEALTELASHRIGALVVVERSQSLRSWVESGRELDAMISRELLLNIFTPNTPLHDGAAILRNGRIAAAGVFLPLTSNEIAEKYGTRHRAGLGMSEETDATVVIVSEENGAISVASEGKLYEDVQADELRAFLTASSGRRREVTA